MRRTSLQTRFLGVDDLTAVETDRRQPLGGVCELVGEVAVAGDDQIRERVDIRGRPSASC
jgi:hypothetical protein